MAETSEPSATANPSATPAMYDPSWIRQPENLELAHVLGAYAAQLHQHLGMTDPPSWSDQFQKSDDTYRWSLGRYQEKLNQQGNKLLDAYVKATRAEARWNNYNAPWPNTPPPVTTGGAVNPNKGPQQPLPSLYDLVEWGKQNGVDTSKVARTDGQPIVPDVGQYQIPGEGGGTYGPPPPADGRGAPTYTPPPPPPPSGPGRRAI